MLDPSRTQYFKDIILSGPTAEQDLSIVGLVQFITITEGIFQPCITCNMTVIDTTGLISNFPIMGFETVTIEDLYGETYSYKIYSMKDHNVTEGKVVGYTLCFIANNYYVSQTQKLSKAYMDVTVSDIVEDIYRNNIGSELGIKEQTSGKYSLIIPNKYPIDAINWLCGQSINSNTGGSNFFFYDTLTKGQIFSSLENMIELQSENLTKDSDIPLPTYKRVMSLNTEDSKGDDFLFTITQVDNRFDTIQNLSIGMFSSHLISHNLIDRSYRIKEFDYLKEFDSRKHNKVDELLLMNKDASSFNSSSHARNFLLPSYTHLFDMNENSLDRDSIIQIRTSQLQQINNNKIVIEVEGNIDLYSGEIIDISDDIEDSEQKEIDHTGRHIIVGIQHIISQHVHTTKLELAKDSFGRGG